MLFIMFPFIFSGKTSSKFLIKSQDGFSKRIYNNIALKLEKQQEKTLIILYEDLEMYALKTPINST